jgi:site-specific recombinase XerD
MVDLHDGAMAHVLRHFYGSQLAVRGVPLPMIQQVMGHTNPATTTIYTNPRELHRTRAKAQVAC